MRLAFTKYHGLGNDYLFVDHFTEPLLPETLIPDIAHKISRRREGVGSDGIVLVIPSRQADANMRIFNADGSEAEVCGNALRCVARLLWDRRYVRSETVTIETGAGIRQCSLHLNDNHVVSVEVDIGSPQWEKSLIPMIGSGTGHQLLITIGNHSLDCSCLSVGNPHCVVFRDDFTDHDVLTLGPQIEALALFPEKVNAGFCHIINRSAIRLAVWERGSGFTSACGTGATAAFAAARYRNKINISAEVIMPGGRLVLREGNDNHYFLSGPAEEVFSGIWSYSASP